ncbi:ferritin-like domain-containing protein [Robbsia sp. KACC 23696]|uniref:ferritin-like domain-containing protein n=1 Tax=Robbsia sp. KACC 23696 TaxID=3149231 RepID=UPI00325ACEE3
MKSLPARGGATLRSASLPGLRAAALDALRVDAPREKAARARALFQGDIAATAADRPSAPLLPPDTPGRPARPPLVDPRELARRNVTTIEGRCVMLHAIAHIEFNAINLALDAVARFDGMPVDFYRDWIRVAAEEGYHFTLLADRLEDLGSAYGAYPAHDGLWEMALRTKDDVLARMALVPRTLEARGLDAAPPIRAKLSAAGDSIAAGIIDIILRDEIGHVAIGNRWYRWLCAREGRDPLAHYAVLARDYRAPRLRGPFNLAARRAAGFDEAELAALQAPAPLRTEGSA